MKNHDVLPERGHLSLEILDIFPELWAQAAERLGIQFAQSRFLRPTLVDKILQLDEGAYIKHWDALLLHHLGRLGKDTCQLIKFLENFADILDLFGVFHQFNGRLEKEQRINPSIDLLNNRCTTQQQINQSINRSLANEQFRKL